MPVVSIIVPIYNSEKYIKTCINSILGQKYQDFELILINDGSNDNSLNIIKEYESTNLKIKVIDKENEGVSKTRNIGIENATGEFIQFIDADDYIEEDYLEDIVNKMLNNKYDLIITGIFLDIYEFEKLKHVEQSYEYKESINKNEIVTNVVDRLDGTYINSPINKLYKRNILIENNIRMKEGLDLGEDLIFNLEYLECCSRVLFEKKSYYHYRMQQEDNLSFKYRENKEQIMKELYDKCYEFICKSGDDYELKLKLNSIFIKWIYSCIMELNSEQCKKSYKEKIKYIENVMKKYRDIINNTYNSGIVTTVLRYSLISSKLAFVIAKFIYIIKVKYRSILYK